MVNGHPLSQTVNWWSMRQVLTPASTFDIMQVGNSNICIANTVSYLRRDRKCDPAYDFRFGIVIPKVQAIS